MTMMLSHALDLAARGFAVFPCLERDKKPACGRGFKDATTNPATLRRWFGNGIHNYNIGLATGAVSGVMVVDVDGSNGAFALADLEAKHGQLPPTLTSAGASGCHLWFRSTGPLQSSKSRIGSCLDVQADGAYLIAPPSVHPDGPTYRWLNDRQPADPPAWLIELARKRSISERAVEQIRTYRGSGTAGPYGQAALEDEIDQLAKTPRGSRNHQLNRASFSLHQLAAGGELGRAEVEHRLLQACEANGLLREDGLRQCLATIRSGAGAGSQHPRSRPAR